MSMFGKRMASYWERAATAGQEQGCDMHRLGRVRCGLKPLQSGEPPLSPLLRHWKDALVLVSDVPKEVTGWWCEQTH